MLLSTINGTRKTGMSFSRFWICQARTAQEVGKGEIEASAKRPSQLRFDYELVGRIEKKGGCFEVQ